jgi:hypothetical protein
MSLAVRKQCIGERKREEEKKKKREWEVDLYERKRMTSLRTGRVTK